MKELIKTVLNPIVVFIKEIRMGYIVLMLSKPAQSQKELFKLIIKNPV